MAKFITKKRILLLLFAPLFTTIVKGQTECTHSKKRRAHMTIEDDKDNDGYGDGDENKNRGKRRGVFSSEALMNQRRGNIQYDFFLIYNQMIFHINKVGSVT